VSEPWLLAVDLGTGGLKTGAVSLRGEVLAESTSAVHTTYLLDGGAVQDTAQWWDQIRSATRSVLASKAVAARDLVGVGITGQWGSTVPVDAEGRAVGECRLWADTRGGPFSARAVGGPVSVLGYSPAKMLRWVQVTGGAPSPSGADPLGHELYMRNCEPELYARTKLVLEPLDYLGLRFTGRAAATPVSMTLSWLTDNRPGRKQAYVP
jgi:xylulokinase